MIHSVLINGPNKNILPDIWLSLFTVTGRYYNKKLWASTGFVKVSFEHLVSRGFHNNI